MLGNIERANEDAERGLHDARERREIERYSAFRENVRVRNIDPDSLAALERGDRQRESGIYESPVMVAEHEGNDIASRLQRWVDDIQNNIVDATDLDRYADDGGPHVG